jgi:hypothetical protein
MKKIIKLLLIVCLLSLPFLGSDCDKILETTGTTGDITGNWVLVYIAGSQHDICPGETIYFPSSTSGNAVLKCPNQPEVTEAYTISNSVLKYTRTSVEYYIRTLNQNELVLEGKSPGNVQYRHLTYNKSSITDYKVNPGNYKTKNSSE